MCAASAGVPMKTIRNGGAAASDADGGGWLAIGLALLGHFGELAPVEVAFDTADAIDKEFAIEMIDLVLQGDCEQFICIDFDLLLIRRPCAHQHAGGALYLGGEVNYGETPLFPHYHA